MSIKLTILERKVQALEQALSFLADNLSMAFPSVGVDFNSIGKGLDEVSREMETLKATKVRSNRDHVFEHNTMLSRDDLTFLIRNYVPPLADLASCDRVYKDRRGGLNRDAIYVVDLGNLSLESMENSINPNGMVSHSLKLHCSIGSGIQVLIEETVTVDMETLTMTVPHDPDLIPLVKWRVVNWFYDQVKRNLPDNQWVLPDPSSQDPADRRQTLTERRIRPAEAIYVRLSVLGDMLTSLAEDNRTQRYGVSVSLQERNKSDAAVIHVYAEKEDDDEAGWMVTLRDIDHNRPFGLNRQDLSVSLPVSPNYDADGFSDFIKRAEKLDLRRLSRLCMILEQICATTDASNETAVRDSESKIYKVTWLKGPAA